MAQIPVTSAKSGNERGAWSRRRRSLLVAIACHGLAATYVSAQPANADRPHIIEAQIGLANHYKIGHWTPVTVEAQGLAALKEPRLEVAVVDSDGVETIAAEPFLAPPLSDQPWKATVFTKVGRLRAPLRVRISDGNAPIVEQTLRPSAGKEAAAALTEMPATAELLASLGTESIGLEQAFPDRDESGNDPARRSIELNSVDALPIDWIGYEALDQLVISIGEGTIARALADDTTRFAALTRWVELGGHLVILCGGEQTKSLPDKAVPLAQFVPGELLEVVNLTELGPLELYAEPAPAIPTTSRTNSLRVPRLAQVRGHIEVYGGRQPTDLPLVVRTPRGLGEITFAGFDLTKAPLAEWPGRRTLLQALLRPIVSASEKEHESQKLVARGYSDLSGALRQQIGRSFALSVPIPFALVALLAIGYLVVLGPIDYLLVRHWLRRPVAAWLTLPVILLVFGGGALGLGEWRRNTNGLGVNRLELIDVDVTTGQARGTLWAAMYSPQANRYDLDLELAAPFNAAATSQNRSVIAAWGLTGRGIGGMHVRGNDLVAVQEGYRYTTDQHSLKQLPIHAAATKSLMARWTAPATDLFDATLSDVQGLVTGSLTNRTGRSLRNARLLYDGWGYWLGNMADGQQMMVGEQLSARRVKTIVTNSALGRTSAGSGQPHGTVFAPERASALELLNLMMFYEAAGGLDFAQLPNRYHAFCDLSGLLKPGMGRAIFVAESVEPGSQLVDASTSAPVGDDRDSTTLVFRIVLPVTTSAETP